jgi:hypothetical protein
MDYPSYRTKGWQIGSDRVEAACKTVVGKRMKGSGTSRGHAEAYSVFRHGSISGNTLHVGAEATRQGILIVANQMVLYEGKQSYSRGAVQFNHSRIASFARSKPERYISLSYFHLERIAWQ